MGVEVWGGVECTVNRVGEVWFDQMKRLGHLERPGDFAMFRELGLRTLRFGMHWERAVEAGGLEVFDAPLREMRRVGIAPIAGLVHHGSGPAGTSLLDPEFGEKLAGYALEVARRYPWIESYTPVNEPHTTARFSALYGHWYPHHRTFASYARAMVNQVRASVLAMRAIRTVNPAAKFVHTEDGGRTYSTAKLRERAEVREQRRWMGVDLLCGRVGREHPMFGYLVGHGISEGEVLWFQDNACAPDVIGLNYYVTSDRFLDHRVRNYPKRWTGGDLREEPLIDIEAVRVRREGLSGAGGILTEAWERYGIAVAITEAHLGGSEADQVRWLTWMWNDVLRAAERGVAVAGFTVWALLGSYDWHTLVTKDEGVYEAGVFDVRTGVAVATPLAGVVREMAAGRRVVQDEAGWWEGEGRLRFPAG